MQRTCLEVQSLFEVTRTTYMYYIIDWLSGGCMLARVDHVFNSAVALCAKLSTFGTDLDIFHKPLTPVPTVLGFAVVCICIHALSYESCFLK